MKTETIAKIIMKFDPYGNRFLRLCHKIYEKITQILYIKRFFILEEIEKLEGLIKESYGKVEINWSVGSTWECSYTPEILIEILPLDTSSRDDYSKRYDFFVKNFVKSFEPDFMIMLAFNYNYKNIT